MIEKARYVKKLLVYLAGVAGELLAMNVVPDPVVPYVAGFVAVLTGLGIYRAENGPQPE